ncbi:MAG: hypothetical protein ABIG63_08470 [Chloroflexota bacterium]
MAGGEWRMANGGWRVAGGGWRVAGGEWRVASGEWRVGESASQRVNPPGFAPVGSVIRQPPAINLMTLSDESASQRVKTFQVFGNLEGLGVGASQRVSGRRSAVGGQSSALL